MDIRQVHNHTKKTYNKIAEKYHRLFRNEMEEKPFDREYLDYFSNLLPKNTFICDAGCGPSGHIGRYLFDKGINVFGIDISDKCIEIASHYNPDMKFECTDYLDWKQNPESLDGIISFYSVIYTPKKEINKILDIFNQKLKPGGKLLVVVKEGAFEGFQDSVLETKVHSYFAEYRENELKEFLLNSGFIIDEIKIRIPYEGEINNKRIYCICTKPGSYDKIN